MYASVPEAVQGIARGATREYASAKSGKSRTAFFSSRVEVCRKLSSEFRKGSSAGAPRAKRALNCPKDKDAEYTASAKRTAGRVEYSSRDRFFFFSIFFLPRQGFGQAFLRGVEIEDIGRTRLTSNENPDCEPDFYHVRPCACTVTAKSLSLSRAMI